MTFEDVIIVQKRFILPFLRHTIHDKSPYHTWIRWYENPLTDILETIPNDISRIGNPLTPRECNVNVVNEQWRLHHDKQH